MQTTDPVEKGTDQSKRPRVLDDLIAQNIETINRIEQESKAGRPRSAVFADAISAYCGSMTFVWVHLVWFAGWLSWNGARFMPKSLQFDPAPFGVLTLIVSLEAIFLSTFILISQNHQQRLADQRNHLDLQINLLAEQENSQMLKMLRDIVEHLGLATDTAKASALSRSTDAGAIAQRLETMSEDTPE